MDIVTGITRGATCTRVKLNTLAKVLNKHLAQINAREAGRRKTSSRRNEVSMVQGRDGNDEINTIF